MGVHLVRAALETDRVKNLISIKAGQLVRQRGFRRHERADIEQELAVYLLGKAHYFDPNRGSVSTFIDRVVQSGVATIWRRRWARLGECCGVVSLERTHITHDGQDKTTLSRALSDTDLHRRTGQDSTDDQRRVDLAADVSGILSALPAGVRRIALCLADASEAAVARELGISRRQVRKAVAVIREQFETVGFPEIFPEADSATGARRK